MEQRVIKTPVKMKRNISLETLELGKSKKATKLQPVVMDVNLEFHELLINKVGKSLAKTKKQLHDTELILNLEPNLDDKIEHRAWEQKLNKKLTQRMNLEFPTLLKKEYAIKKILQKDPKSREKVVSREEWMEKANRIIAKQTQNLQTKVLSGKAKFGGTAKGEVLRTINNYAGGNSIYTDTRTLIRKDGTMLPKPTETSLPPWIGPQYYEVKEVDHMKKSDKFYSLPFKSSARKRVHNPTIAARETLSRRRQAIKNLQPLSSSSPSSSPSPSPTPSPHRNSFTPISTAAHLFSSPLTPRHPSHTPSIYDLHDLKERDQKSVEGEVPSLPTSSRGGSRMGERRNKVPFTTLPRDLSLASSEAFSIPLEGSCTVLSRDPSLTSTLAPLTASDASGVTPPFSPPFPRPLSRQITSPPSNEKTRRKVSVVESPLHKRYAFPLKILASEENGGKQWRGRDYTMNALINQIPLTYHTCDLDAEVDNTNTNSNNNSAKSGNLMLSNNAEVNAQLDAMSRPATVGRLKYSSEVFRIKKVAYKSAEQLMQKARAKDTMTPEPFSRRNSVLSAGGQRSASLSGRVSVMSSNPSSAFPSRPPSSHIKPLPPISSKGTSTNGTPSDESKEASEASDEEDDDDPFGMKGVLRGLEAVEENSHAGHGAPFVMPTPDESFGSAIREWCAQHGVYRFSPSRKIAKDTFLEDHRTLPSLDLSLQGLLMEENPYTEDDVLIKENKDKEMDDINIYV